MIHYIFCFCYFYLERKHRRDTDSVSPVDTSSAPSSALSEDEDFSEESATSMSDQSKKIEHILGIHLCLYSIFLLAIMASNCYPGRREQQTQESQ